MSDTAPDSRRFDDEEVAEILARATQPEGSADRGRPGEAGGLTLAELQSIGAEAGIAPERIADAARELQVRVATPAPLQFLGAPRSVAHIVPLPGPLDDAAWDRLLADLRSTFEAQGRVSVSGSIWSWRNGNLQAHIEPDPDAGTGGGLAERPWRLRMQTRKGSASLGTNFGSFAVPFGILVMILSAFGASNPQGVLLGAGFIVGGLAQLAYLRATLPGWAQTRKAQMEQIAAGVQRQLEP
jgi:hypothetical protein